MQDKPITHPHQEPLEEDGEPPLLPHARPGLRSDGVERFYRRLTLEDAIAVRDGRKPRVYEMPLPEDVAVIPAPVPWQMPRTGAENEAQERHDRFMRARQQTVAILAAEAERGQDLAAALAGRGWCDASVSYRRPTASRPWVSLEIEVAGIRDTLPEDWRADLDRCVHRLRWLTWHKRLYRLIWAVCEPFTKCDVRTASSARYLRHTRRHERRSDLAKRIVRWAGFTDPKRATFAPPAIRA